MSQINTQSPSSLFKKLVGAPYHAVPWLVLFYVIVSCLIYTANGPFTGHMLGFDDQSRMVQVLQWINGGSWYDRTITRVNAPEGFDSIWVRIVDIPIAAVIVIAQFFTDQKTASLVATVLVPLAELAIMFWAARYYARPIAGKAEARLVVLFLMFTTVLNHRNFTFAGFHFGEASHHAWYGILNVLIYGAGIRLAVGVRERSPQLILGVAVALLLAVGVEGIPMIAACIGLMSFIAWIFNNPRLAHQSAIAMFYGAIGGLILLPLHLRPQHWLDISFVQPSILGPTLVAAGATFLKVQGYILSKTKDKLSSTIAIFLTASVIAISLFSLFPNLLSGATSGLSLEEQALAASAHPEVWSMWRAVDDTWTYVGLLIPFVIGVGTALLSIATTANRRRRMMLISYAGFSLIPISLAQIYFRYIHHALTATCPLLLYAWQRSRKRISQTHFHTGILSLCAFILIGPLGMLILPSISEPFPFTAGIALFPGKMYFQPVLCDQLNIAEYLNQHYTPETRVIVPESDSAAFLYHTHLKIDFLSNYPSHNHFIDNAAFYETPDMDVAEDIAFRHHINLVALCAAYPISQAIIDSRAFRKITMVERLLEDHPPDWLKPINMGIRTNYKLFEVDKTMLEGFE